MHHFVAVGVVESAAHLVINRQNRLNRQHRLFLHDLFQRLAFQELHRQVEHTTVLTEIVDRDDVRVSQNSRRHRLALKARLVLFKLLGRETLGKHGLDGDGAANDGVKASIHHTH